MDDDVVYPAPDEIHAIHDRVVARDEGTEPGIRSPDAVESALVYISEGYFNERPETVHEKAAHLMRLLAASHPYVDGNKRTALAAAAYFYDQNGYDLRADDRIRAFLRSFATDAAAADMSAVVAYLQEQATEKQSNQ